ncbi:MAG: hypothetical protein SWZ49_13910 [Cyanobacteriota bacterium]|nr:hypothetical protein [Cyanobacteriota bacterium]
MINLKTIIFGTAAIAIASGGFAQQPAEADYYRNKDSSLIKTNDKATYRTKCFTEQQSEEWVYLRCQRLKCFKRNRRNGAKCRVVKSWRRKVSIGYGFY